MSGTSRITRSNLKDTVPKYDLNYLHAQLTDLTRSGRPVGIVSDAYISLHEEGAREILDAFKVLRDYAGLATSQARNYQEKYEELLTEGRARE